MSEQKYQCPVCGYVGLFEQPYDKYDCPTYEICRSCGTEFGYADWNRSFEELRADWIAGGMKWWSDNDQPKDWDPAKQLETLPKTPLPKTQ